MKKVNQTEKEMLKFWNAQDLNVLKEKIVDPSTWDEEIPIHLDLLFNTPALNSVEKAKTVVEIGCGIGRLLKPLSQEHEKVIGFDISQRMIEEADVYLSNHKDNTETYLLGLDGKFPLESETVDLVYSIVVFQHIHDIVIIKKYLKESMRILKKGGLIRIQTHMGIPSIDGKFHGFAGQMYESLDSFANEFSIAGFEVVESSEGQGHEHWLWVTAKKKDV